MRNADYMQLMFAFADKSPKGGDGLARDIGEPVHPVNLSQIASIKEQDISATASTGTNRLMEQIASPWNLEMALKKVVANNGAPGMDKLSVSEVEKNSREILRALRESLLLETYRPGDVRRVWIPKPGGGKRGLNIPDVIDRVVQTAIHQILAPIFEPTFHNSSHGFRPNRGVCTAIAEVKQHLSDGYSIVVDMDIAKFFDCVNHQRLLARIAQKIKDKRVLQLIHRLLKTHVVMPDGVRVQTTEGAGQGGPLSPLLSNIVLDELDWELERRGLRFVRYADDCNVYVHSERAGRRVLEATKRFLERKLRLKLNEDKSSVTTPKAHFLGFSFKKGEEGLIEVLLSERTEERINKRIRELTPRTWGNTIKQCFKQLNQYLKGWFGYFGLCTLEARYSFRKFDAHVRRRIRAIIIRQKKRLRFLYRHLMRRGLSQALAASTAFRRCGLWAKSKLNGMHKAYPNNWFKERGLVSLVDLHSKRLSLVPCPMQPVAVKSGGDRL